MGNYILDFIGNAPAGFLDQSDAAHPAGFPIVTILFISRSALRMDQVSRALYYTSMAEFRTCAETSVDKAIGRKEYTELRRIFVRIQGARQAHRSLYNCYCNAQAGR